jgi:hypothetical protein
MLNALTTRVTALEAGGGASPVTSVNGRTGAVTITNADVTAALGFALGTAASLTSDTDGTLAANSDLRVATQKATKTYVGAQIANLIASAPGALDTLNELAAAMGNDANFSTTVTNALAGKFSKAGDTATYVAASGQTLVSGGVVPVGFSHTRVGQVGYHLYNGGAVTEWLIYQPAHATGDELRIATAVGGVVTDRVTIAPSGSVSIPGLRLGLSFNINTDFTISETHNNYLLTLIGSHTVTADAVPSGGLSVIIVNLGGSWTFSCAGGVYLDGATATVTSATIPAGARVTAIHLGGGVWVLTGV